MTKKDLLKLKKLLEHIKDPDGHVQEMIAAVNKDLAIYAKAKGQLRGSYEYDM